MAHKLQEKLTEHEILSTVMYRDALILVLNKPSGLPVHNAGGSQHNLSQYMHLLRFGLPKDPELAHRLDLGTSGCLVLARNTFAAQTMQKLFSEGTIKKKYLAWVRGEVATDFGIIDVNMAKLSNLKKHWWMKADPSGPITAKTEYKTLKRDGGRTLLELIPHTGRTHQLRVHCAYLGHPIIGDYIYSPNGEQEKSCLLHLHAHSITLPLYPKKPPLYIEAPAPEHFDGGKPSLV